MILEDVVKGKRILFVTTKNIDYIRNVQELRILKTNALSVEIVYSEKKNYILRIIDVWRKTTVKKVNEADAVFVGFEPQFVIPYVGYLFKNKPVYIDCFISVYDTLVWDRKKFKDKSLLARYFHYMDERTLKRADLVITDTVAHTKYYVEEFHVQKYKFETIYLEADSTIYYPREQRKSENIKDKFVVLYFGSVLPLQGVDVILDAVRELKNENDIYFDIIGPIPDVYNKPIQGNVEYTDWLSQESLAEHIAQADLCLAGHFNGDIGKARRTIAGKAYIYEKMGKIMILGDNSTNREVFKEDDRHRYVAMSSSELLAKEIIKEGQAWKKKS